MNPDILTTSAQELLNQSIRLAQELKNPTLQPLHTLAAGLDNDFCSSFFSVLHVNIQELRSLVLNELGKLPIVQGGQLSSDYTLEDFLKECEKEAKALNDQYVSLEHFLIEWTETKYLPPRLPNFLNVRA